MTQPAAANPTAARPRSRRGLGGLPRHRPRPASRRGFSFVEVLFAVMILGIGFIMIAGIFPVAISQAQGTADETISASVARGAVEYMAKSINGTPGLAASIKPDDVVHPFDGTMGALVRGNQILPEDPRYGFVPFYRRSMNNSDPTNPQAANSLQVIVIAVRAKNHAAYTAADLASGALQGKPITATFTPDNNIDNPDTVTFDTSSPFLAAAAPGAFVVIGSDKKNSAANGWVFRLGNAVNTTTWELAPGNDMKGLPYKPASADVFIVGQGADAARGRVHRRRAGHRGVLELRPTEVAEAASTESD